MTGWGPSPAESKQLQAPGSWQGAGALSRVRVFFLSGGPWCFLGRLASAPGTGDKLCRALSLPPSLRLAFLGLPVGMRLGGPLPSPCILDTQAHEHHLHTHNSARQGEAHHGVQLQTGSSVSENARCPGGPSAGDLGSQPASLRAMRQGEAPPPPTPSVLSTTQALCGGN